MHAQIAPTSTCMQVLNDDHRTHSYTDSPEDCSWSCAQTKVRARCRIAAGASEASGSRPHMACHSRRAAAVQRVELVH